MKPTDKPLVWLRGEVKTPPFSAEARLEAGSLLVIADVFQKTTRQTPDRVIADCARRLASYDRLTRED